MIIQIIQLYLHIFLPLLLISVGLFAIGTYFIFRINSDKKAQTLISATILTNSAIDNTEHSSFSPEAVAGISGENPFDSQLDLARAYIESDKKKLAHNIIKFVLENGTSNHQQRAKHLLKLL